MKMDHTIIHVLRLHSIDATQTALADKGVIASERTLYRWKQMIDEIPPTDDDTVPLITALAREIEEHRATTPDSSDDEKPPPKIGWKYWKTALNTVRTMKLSFKKDPGPLLRSPTL